MENGILITDDFKHAKTFNKCFQNSDHDFNLFFTKQFTLPNTRNW